MASITSDSGVASTVTLVFGEAVAAVDVEDFRLLLAAAAGKCGEADADMTVLLTAVVQASTAAAAVPVTKDGRWMTLGRSSMRSVNGVLVVEDASAKGKISIHIVRVQQ